MSAAAPFCSWLRSGSGSTLATGCSLAGRSGVGARSEDEVRRALAPLQADGWRLRHSLRWQGRGDIDSLAIAPTGVGFAIEIKTRAYDDRHLARVCDQAAWLSRRRRRWCRRGAVPVVCLVRARGVQRLERNVLVVSIDRLIPVLRSAAGGAGAGAPRRCPRAAELSERSTRHAEWRTTTRGVGPMTGFPTFNANLGVTGRAVYRAEGDRTTFS